MAAFYAGLVQDTSKTIADSFLFFLLYNFLRQSRLKRHEGAVKHLSAVDELGVGFLAGAISRFCTTPLANIVTRKQSLSMVSQRSANSNSYDSSVRSIAHQINTEKGLLGFWSGYSASLVLTLNPSLTFFLFETFKRTLLHRNQRANPSPQAIFILAAISKAIASTITYPFSLAKARAQVSRNTDQSEKSTPTRVSTTSGGKRDKQVSGNVFSIILQIAQNEGIGSLYKGLDGEVLKGFFSHGITMIVKESVHRLIIRLYFQLLKLLQKYPSPQDSAATAKVNIAQVAEKTNFKAMKMAESTKAHATHVPEDIGEQKNHITNLAQRGVEILGSKGQQVIRNSPIKSNEIRGNNQETWCAVEAIPTSNSILNIPYLSLHLILDLLDLLLQLSPLSLNSKLLINFLSYILPSLQPNKELVIVGVVN